jgi:hypothetical protein
MIMATTKKTAAPKPEPVKVPGGKYKRTSALVLPVLRLLEESSTYVKIDGAMHVGSEQRAPKKGEQQMEPATVMPVTDLETGELGMVIVNTVLQGILSEKYPDDSYVGKSFEIIKHAKRDGKRYHNFSVFEIEA